MLKTKKIQIAKCYERNMKTVVVKTISAKKCTDFRKISDDRSRYNTLFFVGL